MLAESALRSALDKVTPIKLAGKFWRVVTTSSLLGLVRGENGQPEVTRIHPNLLFVVGMPGLSSRSHAGDRDLAAKPTQESDADQGYLMI